MAVSTTVTFTADTGKLVLGGNRTFSPPAELVTADFQGREPVAWAAAQEFQVNGTTSGTVTITAA